MIYNSALKNGTKQFEGVHPTERFEHDGCIGFRRNIITEGMHPDFESCDIIYCEPPFPAGLKIFDKRANEKTSSYRDFAEAFVKVFDQLPDVPRCVITNFRLRKYLPEPDREVKVKLNRHWENLSCWGVDVPEGMTNLNACEFLGTRYRRIGDFTCGYGVPVLAFRHGRQGNTFVASDYDPHCVTVLRGLMNER